MGWWRSCGCRSLSTQTSHSRSFTCRFRSPARLRRRSRRRCCKRSKARRGVGNIHNITSLALEGVASTWIEFQIGTPIDRAVADVRDAVAKVRSNLPPGIMEPIVQACRRGRWSDRLLRGRHDDETDAQLSWFVDNTVTKRLLAIPGVAQVESRRWCQPRNPRRARSRRACRRSASRLWM